MTLRAGGDRGDSAGRVAVMAAVALTILGWGFAFVPLKRLTNAAYTDHPLSPGTFLLLRFVPLLPFLLLLAARWWRRETPEMRSRLRDDWLAIAAMGILVIPGYHIPLNLALRTPLHTGLTSLFLNLSPALTYFIAVSIGQEKPRRARTAGVLVAFAGLAAIFVEELIRDWRGGERILFSWEGSGWMLISTLAWTFYTLIARKIASRHDARFVFMASQTVGTFAVLAAAPLLAGPEVFSECARLDALDWAYWAYVSLFSSFLAYWVWVLALARFEASRLASTGNIIPLIVHGAAVLFLESERTALTPFYVLCASATVLGTTLVLRRTASPSGIS